MTKHFILVNALSKFQKIFKVKKLIKIRVVEEILICWNHNKKIKLKLDYFQFLNMFIIGRYKSANYMKKERTNSQIPVK